MILTRSVVAGLGASALLLVSSPSRAVAGCEVTLKGSYTTPVEGSAKILVYLNGTEPSNTAGLKTSQVRVKLGTWYKIKGCTWSTRTYYPGDSFTVACTLDFGCGKDRRYRLYVRALDSADVVINDGFKYFPSEDGFTEKTTIDFGDLGKVVQ